MKLENGLTWGLDGVTFTKCLHFLCLQAVKQAKREHPIIRHYWPDLYVKVSCFCFSKERRKVVFMRVRDVLYKEVRRWRRKRWGKFEESDSRGLKIWPLGFSFFKKNYGFIPYYYWWAVLNSRGSHSLQW
jgi:hypothetical protein